MNAEIRKLPIGIQSFEDLRNNDYVYVDKTALLYQLVTTGKPYFLSRPRRFGKSLFLSTLEAYFLGKRELFKGLAIDKLETDWFEFPVLHLDLNAEKYDSPQALDAILSTHLTRWEEIYGKGTDERTLSTRFSGIIRRAVEKTGRQAVVLIDEYDKPLLQALGDEALQTDYRNTLKAFYGVLKTADPYLKFVFLTGVTKFAHVSVFSDLNQLDDISMRQDYTSVCGITKEELVTNFVPELEEIAGANNLSVDASIQKMAEQYDGYHFYHNSVGIFNPFSVLNALKYRSFDSYWFQTGTPTFLVELLKKSEYDLRLLLNGVEMRASAFSEYRVEANNPIPLLYQSGYLTIKGYDKEFGLYTLGFPNEEVKYGFINFITPFYTAITEDQKWFLYWQIRSRASCR